MSLRRLPRALATFAMLASLPLAAVAQKEGRTLFGGAFGGEFIPSTTVTSSGSSPVLSRALRPDATTAASRLSWSNSLTIQLFYDRAFVRRRSYQLGLDVPALVGPNHRRAASSGNPLLPTSNATFFVTPSARLEFLPSAKISPWVSAGFGYGLYETSDKLANGSNNRTIHTSTGTAQFGAGVDVKTPIRILWPVGLRGEFRDFYTTSQPFYYVPVADSSQHNYTVNGGAFFRF